MKNVFAIMSLAVAAFALATPAVAQPEGKYVYIYAFYPPENDPMPWKRTIVNYSRSDLSAEDAKTKACSGFLEDVQNWTKVCQSQPSFKPFPYEPRLRSFTCQDHLSVFKANYESCISPTNSVACSSGFMAIVKSRHSLTVGDDNAEPTAAGIVCGKGTQADAWAAAKQACESNVAKRGLTYNNLCR